MLLLDYYLARYHGIRLYGYYSTSNGGKRIEIRINAMKVRQGPLDSMSGRPVLERGHIMAPAVRVWLPDVSGHKVTLGRDMWEKCLGPGNSLRAMRRCS